MRLLGNVCVALLLATSTHCAVVDEFADEDGDGWFTRPNNLATTLTLTTVTFSNPQQGRYRILIDDVRFPNSAATGSLDEADPNGWLAVAPTDTATMNQVVTSRFQGRNAYTGSGAVGNSMYSSTVRVQGLSGFGVYEVGTTTVTYTSDGGQTLTVSVGGGAVASVALTFTTTSTRFADPNPTVATGDSDGDGVLENEESQMVSAFRGVGEPAPREHAGPLPRHRVYRTTLEYRTLWRRAPEDSLLCSQYQSACRQRHHEWPSGNRRADDPGGTLVAPGTAITQMQAASIRTSNLAAGRRRFVHLALMTAGVAEGGFGLANGIPGNLLVMRTQLEPLSPNFFNYQVGVLMHELGHLLGLCHPTLQDGTWRLRSDPDVRARSWNDGHGRTIGDSRISVSRRPPSTHFGARSITHQHSGPCSLRSWPRAVSSSTSLQRRASGSCRPASR